MEEIIFGSNNHMVYATKAEYGRMVVAALEMRGYDIRSVHGPANPWTSHPGARQMHFIFDEYETPVAIVAAEVVTSEVVVPLVLDALALANPQKKYTTKVIGRPGMGDL